MTTSPGKAEDPTGSGVGVVWHVVVDLGKQCTGHYRWDRQGCGSQRAHPEEAPGALGQRVPLEVRVPPQPAGTFRRVVSVPAPLRASP